MDDQKCILLVSRDMMALQARKLLIGAYFEVHVAGRVPEAKQLLSERVFDLIVLCYSVSEDDCKEIARAAHERCAKAKLLILTIDGTAARKTVDHVHFAPEEGPFYLLKRSAELLGFEFKRKSGMVQVTSSSFAAA